MITKLTDLEMEERCMSGWGESAWTRMAEEMDGIWDGLDAAEGRKHQAELTQPGRES